MSLGAESITEQLSVVSTKDLGAYLQDHYAGSVVAVELLDHLISAHAGEPFEIFFGELRTDIVADQDELRDLMHALAVQESGLRNAGAWMAEKFSQVMLGLTAEKQGGLGLLQALEALVLGITGKQRLWQALAAALTGCAQLPPIDFARLERRAVEQRDRVEAKRLETAEHVLALGYISFGHLAFSNADRSSFASGHDYAVQLMTKVPRPANAPARRDRRRRTLCNRSLPHTKVGRSKTREVIVIGGGIAGLSAAVYLGRAQRDTLVIDSGHSMAAWEPLVRNYLGFPNGVSGEALLGNGRAQAKRQLSQT